jgi:ATP-dependent exoDNAse (exonuclease V) beta subunit
LKALPETNGLREWEIEKLEDFIARIEIAQKYANLPDTTPVMLMDHLANELGLEQFYKDNTLKAVELDQASDENLLEVVTSISNEFNNSQTFFEYIYKFVNDEISELHQDKPSRDEVMISTIHKAKGKEFTNVVYFNLSEKSNNKKIDDVEEERRVAYVAVTRPKDNLLVTSLKSKPSPFLKELALSPDLKKYTNPELQVRLTKKKRTRNLYEKEIDKLIQLKEDLETQYPELTGEDLLINYKIKLVQRLVEWIRLRRLEAASKKLGKCEEKLLHLNEEELVPINDQIDLLTSELHFRNILSEDEPSN